jgi:hypothetical protein
MIDGVESKRAKISSITKDKSRSKFSKPTHNTSETWQLRMNQIPQLETECHTPPTVLVLEFLKLILSQTLPRLPKHLSWNFQCICSCLELFTINLHHKRHRKPFEGLRWGGKAIESRLVVWSANEFRSEPVAGQKQTESSCMQIAMANKENAI